MSLIGFAARMAGVPQDTIDELEKAAPNAAALLNLLKDNQLLVNKIVAVANEAEPLITQALPLAKQAIAEIETILPAAQKLVAFIQQQQPEQT